MLLNDRHNSPQEDPRVSSACFKAGAGESIKRHFYQFYHMMRDGLSKYLHHNGGTITIIFAFSIMPIIGLFGAAIDLSSASRTRAQMQAASDTAVLVSVSEVYAKYYNTTSFRLEQGRNAANKEFLARAISQGFNSKIKRITADSKMINEEQMEVTLCFEGAEKASMLSAVGYSSIALSGCASALSSRPIYSKVYVLVDASGSMGIGADAKDRTKMVQLSNHGSNLFGDYNIYGNCEFLCHTVSPTNGDFRSSSQQSLFRPEFRSQFRTRFDVVQGALITALEGARSKFKFANQFQFNIYKFSNYLTEVAPLTSDIDGLKSKVSAMTPDRRGAGTNYTSVMKEFAKKIPKGGDGSSLDKAKVFVLILSDGLETHVYELTNCEIRVTQWSHPKNVGVLSPEMYSSCEYSVNPNHPNYNPNDAKYDGWWAVDPNSVYPGTPSYHSYAWAMHSRSCQPLKDTGAHIMVMAADVYEGWWATVGNQNLRNCATNVSSAYRVNSASDVDTAITQLFNVILDKIRLSQ